MMPRVCPRPCSRLATAAVFISVGVVQFVVGIVLLRSKYVYLLAGPDFWTSSCNISVGCLLGLSASVWKQSRKRQSKKHAMRRNLLLALLFSALILNATTLGILLLGEGNTLLSIRLESSGKYSNSTFASEVLAYAYVTSICCPIVCIVVSIVSMSGSCFKYASRKKLKEMKTPLNSLKKEHLRSLRWVYTPDLLDLSKKKVRDLVLSSISESSSDDDSDVCVYQKSTNSPEDIQRVLNRMAQGKRDTILSDSAIMLRQMDIRRKNRYDSLNQDGSYIVPALPRVRESTVNTRKYPKDTSTGFDQTSQRNGKHKTDNSDINSIARLPAEDVNLRRTNYSKSKQHGMLYKNPYISEELLNEYQTTSSKLSKHFPSQYKKFRERLQTGSEIAGPTLSCISDITDYGIKNIDTTHRKSKEVSEVEVRDKNKSSRYLRQKSNPELSSEKREIARENIEYERYESVKETSPSINDCFSPDESEFGDDSTFDFSRTSSWASEIVPINVKHSSVARLSNKLIPVASPVVPVIRQKKDVPKISDDSGIGTIESNSFNEVANQSDSKDRKDSLSSFLEEDSKFGNKENTQQYPKIGPQSIKKYDLNRMATMASISEESNVELNRSEDENRSQEEVRKMIKSHSRNKSLSSSHSETSKESNQSEDNSGKDVTPKRKKVTGKSLRKIWSIAASEKQNDFLDQVVDEDSLIGLTEEELIARQIRTRSIRKAIQQRIKEDMSI